MKRILLATSLTFLIILAFLASSTLNAQGYLHRSGIYIKDGAGNDFILRGIGTGNWLIQEGYMMQSSSVAGTQHEFEAKLESLIGAELKDSFYTVWLDSHFRRIDVDSMKSWGFNSVRVAMHYKWFTPPIEKEPVPGEITWFEEGFQRIDSLLDWCGDNEMYLILDLHGAPGGQGKNASISDYDPSKPSLWESQANKNKTVALWKKLAERYTTEPWIGGYDLINETNWTFTPNNNSQMLALFKTITDSIRAVDKNHLIFIEGNSFANDFSGLTPAWDDNMAYSFHKYWDNPTQESFSWAISLRSSTQRPIWLGESGENSNSWFTSAIALCEKNKIGWSWWPVKKPGINNPLKVTVNSDYTQLIKYWEGTVPKPTVDVALNAVLQFALNHKLENCSFQKDVIDAMFRQTKTIETIPFKHYQTGENVFMVDYNLGRNKYAYFDTDTASTGGSSTEWNKGWSYRNDGVDIESCTDALATNGYDIGWTATGEWMEYTIEVDSTAAYTLGIRSASGSGSSRIHMEMDGKVVSPSITLPSTGGWKTWKTTEVNGIMLTKGTRKLRFVFDQGGSNLNFFKLSNPVASENIDFAYLTSESSINGNNITVYLNKPITSVAGDASLSDFVVTINNTPVEVTSLSFGTTYLNTIVLNLAESLYYGGAIKLSYQGSTIQSGSQTLVQFADAIVTNKLPYRFTIPATIQAEDFSANVGLSSETCTDVGAGKDMGYAASGEYLDFYVNVPLSKYYTINIRAASARAGNQVIFRKVVGTAVTPIDTIDIPSTGGWQTWKTYTTEAYMEAGRYTIRMFIKAGEFNTNWIQFLSASGVKVQTEKVGKILINPNPASDFIEVDLAGYSSDVKEISIYNAIGIQVKSANSIEKSMVRINTSDLGKGMYYVVIKSDNLQQTTSKLVIQ